MSNLYDVLNTVSNALGDSAGFDLGEIDKGIIALHTKLDEPEWAIEDELLREECQKLVVQFAAHRYLEAHHPKSKKQ